MSTGYAAFVVVLIGTRMQEWGATFDSCRDIGRDA